MHAAAEGAVLAIVNSKDRIVWIIHQAHMLMQSRIQQLERADFPYCMRLLYSREGLSDPGNSISTHPQ